MTRSVQPFFFRFFLAVLIVAMMLAATMYVAEYMAESSTSEPTQAILNSLERRVEFYDFAVLVALALSVIFGCLLFHYKSRLAVLQKAQIASLELGTATAHQLAEAAKLDAISAQKGLEEAKAEVERERIKRLNLQKAVAWREVDVAVLAQELRPFAGHTIVLDSFQDLETSLLVEQFTAAGKTAAIKIKPRHLMFMTTGTDWSGIKIIGRLNRLQPDGPLARLAFAIRSHFESREIPVEIQHASDKAVASLPDLSDAKTLLIQIGRKPPIKLAP